MAHFAKINSNNIVEEVLVVTNDAILDGDGKEQEQLGIDLLKNITGHDNWKMTSYNTRAGVHLGGGTQIRKNFASIGMIYDATRDAFYEQKPYNSWTLNDTSCVWEAPLPLPSDASEEDEIWYNWNEDAYQADNTKGWELRTFEE